MSEIIYLSFSDWLISLSIMFSRSIHAVAKGKSFFFHSHIVFHCFFINSSTDEHSGYFQIFVVVNNAAMNIGVHMFLICVLGFFGYIPRSGITGSKGIFLIFWSISILLSTVAAPVCILMNRAKVFPFFTSSPALVVCWFIDDSHSDRCEVVSHCGFNLHFSGD